MLFATTPAEVKARETYFQNLFEGMCGPVIPAIEAYLDCVYGSERDPEKWLETENRLQHECWKRGASWHDVLAAWFDDVRANLKERGVAVDGLSAADIFRLWKDSR